MEPFTYHAENIADPEFVDSCISCNCALNGVHLNIFMCSYLKDSGVMAIGRKVEADLSEEGFRTALGKLYGQR